MERREQVAERLRSRRLALGLKQGELGAAIGVSLQRISNLERGVVEMGAIEAAQIAGELVCSSDWLLFVEGAAEPVAAEIVRLRRRGLTAEQAAAEFRRLPRRPQARCAARPEADNQAYRKAG